MSDYIEKETVRRIIKEQERIHGIRGAGWIELAMDKYKSVDIVRCEECKYWGDEDGINEKDGIVSHGAMYIIISYMASITDGVRQKMIFVPTAKGGNKMRLIDADALIDNRSIQINIGAGDNICIDVSDISKAPTIEAEPVRHGKWIKFHDELSKCSLCNYPVYTGWNQTKYCPECGAKMDGGDENEDGVD